MDPSSQMGCSAFVMVCVCVWGGGGRVRLEFIKHLQVESVLTDGNYTDLVINHLHPFAVFILGDG